MDDRDLTERLARDLDGTFEVLVRIHVDRCHAIALRILGNHADAEEATQDALVGAYRALSSFAPERIAQLHLRAWLATIVVNGCRNRLRRPAVAATPLEPLLAAGLEPAATDAAGDPEGHHARRARARVLADLVAALPERYRIPVVLRHVGDLSYPELAEVLGRPEGTLRAQVHRGLAMLRAAADREELTA